MKPRDTGMELEALMNTAQCVEVWMCMSRDMRC